MLYALDPGHNAPPKDIGAKGIGFEDELILAVTNKLKTYLEENGHRTILVLPKGVGTVRESLNARCKIANDANADRFVSIHFNAFNSKAHGAEIYVSSPRSKAYNEAKNILNNIAKQGFTNRGVKSKMFQVIRNTKCPAMLVECCFCDSKRDMDLFDADEMAQAIASGLLNKDITGSTGSDPVIDDLKVELTVIFDTVLKPSTYQSNEIDARELQPIAPGDYQVALLAEEENHYCIRFPGQEKEWFIYSEHCTIEPVK